MPLSLTTRRRLQTSSTRWSSQQHLSSQDPLQRQTQLSRPTVRKQRSFIEPSAKLITSYNNPPTTGFNNRPYLTRGLSAGRSQDIERVYPRHLLKRNPSISHNNNSSNNGHKVNGSSTKSSKSEDLIKKNITACGKVDRPSRSVQAWSSTSSILKSLDKELAQLNGVLGKNKDTRKDNTGAARDNTGNSNNNKSTNKTKTDSGPTTAVTTIAANAKVNSSNKYSSSTTTTATSKITAEVNKVNLSIVLSHALNPCKDNDYILSEPGEEDESDDSSSTDSEQLRTICDNKTLIRDSKKSETTSKVPVPAQQRRVLYHSSKLSPTPSAPSNTLTNNSSSHNNSRATTPITSGLQNPQNFHVSPSLTIQRRAPLQRAMSAPVRSFDENSKGSFLANKRKSRRRKLNARTITCDRDSSPPEHLTNVKDLNLDAKSTDATNKKILQRSRSVAPDVITLVSLISSEGSDSEKEEFSSTPTNSDCNNSPTRRAPSLRKAGKSVSFQENYPPTFQFASKEYSHMLRRGSIAPLAARIKSNRPPTAPPVSIFHTANNNNNKNNTSKTSRGMNEANASSAPTDDNSKNDGIPPTNTITTTISLKKTVEEETYKYPDYVRSLKERECWKLFQKMAAKGVNITYDTILRGMLTPTEFRQLQKQREAEEAKALKEQEELAAALLEEQQKSKKHAPPVERLPSVDNSLSN